MRIYVDQRTVEGSLVLKYIDGALTSVLGICDLSANRQAKGINKAGYLKREAKTWERLQESVALMDGKTDIEGVQPMHDKMRGMLLLKRSKLTQMHYPNADERCK